MSLEEKINKIIEVQNRRYPDDPPHAPIEKWQVVHNHRVDNLMEQIFYLVVDAKIVTADLNVCLASSSSYIRDIRAAYEESRGSIRCMIL